MYITGKSLKQNDSTFSTRTLSKQKYYCSDELIQINLRSRQFCSSFHLDLASSDPDLDSSDPGLDSSDPGLESIGR